MPPPLLPPAPLLLLLLLLLPSFPATASTLSVRPSIHPSHPRRQPCHFVVELTSYISTLRAPSLPILQTPHNISTFRHLHTYIPPHSTPLHHPHEASLQLRHRSTAPASKYTQLPTFTKTVDKLACVQPSVHPPLLLSSPDLFRRLEEEGCAGSRRIEVRGFLNQMSQNFPARDSKSPQVPYDQQQSRPRSYHPVSAPPSAQHTIAAQYSQYSDGTSSRLGWMDGWTDG